jgi:hypothetical protein
MSGSKSYKLKLWQPKQREAIHVARFDLPKHLQPLDLQRWSQPIHMVRQGCEENAPAAELEPSPAAASSVHQKHQNQLNELRVCVCVLVLCE